MRYRIPISILACSLSFAMAVSPPLAKGKAPVKSELPSPEMAVPAAKKAPGLEKTKKAPTPQAKPEPEEEEDPVDSPAEAEDNTDCDDCVIVQADPSRAPHPAVAAAPVAMAGLAPAAAGTRQAGWPMAVARTLWGLFFVGRPRLIPRTRIRGVTVR